MGHNGTRDTIGDDFRIFQVIDVGGTTDVRIGDLSKNVYGVSKN